MTETIFLTIVTASLSALVTYFFTTIVSKKASADIVKAIMAQHERLYHSDKMPDFVKMAIAEHKAHCDASNDIKKVVRVVLAIYAQGGGDIKDLDI